MSLKKWSTIDYLYFPFPTFFAMFILGNRVRQRRPDEQRQLNRPLPDMNGRMGVESSRMAPRVDMREAAANSCIRFLGVEKTYDGAALVVKRLDLDVAEGEFLTLLGPSGSGKTTTLMMLAGFESPTAGSILLRGKPIERLPPHKRGIGVVFQNYALFPHMSVAENVFFPLRMRRIGRAQAKERIDRALDMVRMRGFADRKPSQLSGGQQQRAALARALVFDPELVLMDEPLGALDKQLREHMQLEIKQLHQELGISVVYVTHDQSEALTMSDRIAIFNDGIVQQLGAPAEIYNEPATPFVAQFIGDNNMISATVIASDRGIYHLRLSECGEPAPTIRARSIKHFSVGQKVLVSIRPEKISVSREPEFENRIEAIVRQTIYHGDHIRLQASVGGVTVIVKTTAAKTSGSDLQPGATVSLGWKPDDSRAFSDGS